MIPEMDQETGLTAVAGALSGWLFFKKFLVKSKKEDVKLQAEGAQMDVITLMRDEIKRLNESNKGLTDTVNDFIRITQELTSAIHGMENENIRLKLEVSQLNRALVELKAKLECIRTRKTDIPLHNNTERRSSELY